MLKEELSLRMATRSFHKKSLPVLMLDLVQQLQHMCRCVHTSTHLYIQYTIATHFIHKSLCVFYRITFLTSLIPLTLK